MPAGASGGEGAFAVASWLLSSWSSAPANSSQDAKRFFGSLAIAFRISAITGAGMAGDSGGSL